MAGAGIILAAGAALDRRVILLTTSVAVASVVAVVLSVVLRTDPTAV